MEYLSCIIPPEIITYHVKPFMRARDIVRLFGSVDISRYLASPITYRIFNMDMSRKCKRCIVYETQGDIILGYTVSNYYQGKEITYFSWPKEENLVYAERDGIRYNDVYIKSYDIYPTCIPLGSDVGICDDIILRSLDVLFNEGYIIFPYNDEIREMNTSWKMPNYTGNDELELEHGVRINISVSNKYHSIIFDDYGKIKLFHVESPNIWSYNIEDCNPDFKNYVNETLGVNIM